MAEEKPKRREHGCLSLLLGLGFILLVLTLVFGWDIAGRHYGIAFRDGQIVLIWAGEVVGENDTTTASGEESREESPASEETAQ
jgi:hypothetical protein